MSDLYKKLTLPPTEKLVNYSELYNAPKSYENSYKVRDAKDMLTPYAFEFFKSYNLEPTFVIDLIPQDTVGGAIENRTIHIDSTGTSPKWKPIVCGINFELLEDSEAEFSWWDMGSLKPKQVYEGAPDSTDIELKIKLRGLVYGAEGIPEGAVALAKLRYGTTPYLCRTDVPHTVTFNNSSGKRHGLSIRFKEQWSTWEECCQVFEPLVSK